MTVRDALIGLLTIGPAYGLQLHAELGTRAPHRAGTNVGQVYGTLDRLTHAGLVLSAGLSTDGLPLYALTPSGAEAARSWLAGEGLSSLPEWADVQDMVLISSSIDPGAAAALLKVLASLCQPTQILAETTEYLRLSLDAQRRYRDSVSAWLEDVAASGNISTPQFALGRPKRGRPAKN